MENPFVKIDERLSGIERIALELYNHFHAHPGISQGAEKPLNITEASTFLGIPKNTLYGLTSRREIPFYKPAKHLLFLKEELIEWVKAARQSTITEIQAAARKGVRCA